MRASSSIRLVVLAAVAAGVCASGVSWGQDGTSRPMGVPSSLPATAPTGTTAAPAKRSANRADIDYTGGLLRITANNSSLNQILREVGRQTGMKITGGVQDDRVFGSYGPAPASAVLASLLDGTSSNLLIVENDSNGPAELILTPRHGGATPPNPNAASAEDNNVAPPAQQQTFQPVPRAFQNRPEGGPVGQGGLPASNGGQTGTPVDGGANLGTTPGAFAGFGQTPADATAQPNGDSGDVSQPQSPNGVSTPQQIYEQLQRLRQQNAQQQQQP